MSNFLVLVCHNKNSKKYILQLGQVCKQGYLVHINYINYTLHFNTWPIYASLKNCIFLPLAPMASRFANKFVLHTNQFSYTIQDCGGCTLFHHCALDHYTLPLHSITALAESSPKLSPSPIIKYNAFWGCKSVVFSKSINYSIITIYIYIIIYNIITIFNSWEDKYISSCLANKQTGSETDKPFRLNVWYAHKAEILHGHYFLDFCWFLNGLDFTNKVGGKINAWHGWNTWIFLSF